MSNDRALDYFGDGVAESIIGMLSRYPHVLVTARNTSFMYKGKSVDIRLVGKELNVGYVLEGSVQKGSDKVRIIAQLIDTASGEHVWSDRFDEEGSDPLALQDRGYRQDRQRAWRPPRPGPEGGVRTCLGQGLHRSRRI